MPKAVAICKQDRSLTDFVGHWNFEDKALNVRRVRNRVNAWEEVDCGKTGGVQMTFPRYYRDRWRGGGFIGVSSGLKNPLYRILRAGKTNRTVGSRTNYSSAIKLQFSSISSANGVDKGRWHAAWIEFGWKGWMYEMNFV